MAQLTLDEARHRLFLSLSRISQCWGLPRAMGAIFGALYLSPEPLSLDELARQAGITKGAVSTNVRALERMGLVHKQLRVGERKDYYFAETDFWKSAKNILEQRRRVEFDSALGSVRDILEAVKSTPWKPAEAPSAAFYRQRLQAMQDFFRSLDALVSTVLKLDRLRSRGLGRRLRGERKER